MNFFVWQSALEELPDSDPPPLLDSSASPSSEDSTATRVTPSMSLRSETKPATASWPVAQPMISSAGPGTESRSAMLAPPLTETSGLTVPVRFVSQTSRGRIRESSRITRSQSKRLSASWVTVATRWSWTCWNWV